MRAALSGLALVLIAAALLAVSVPVGSSHRARPDAPAPKAHALLDVDQVPPAGEYVRYPELDRWGSIFAMRPAHFRCPTPDAWAANPLSLFVWAYTTLEWNYAIVDPTLCEAALAVAQGRAEEEELWRIGVAVSTLVHEMYHVRRWGARGNEAKVQCKAVRHFQVGMRLLGAEEELVQLTLPWALVDHWRTARLYDEYYEPDCEPPNPW